jgi:hypothetical protein
MNSRFMPVRSYPRLPLSVGTFASATDILEKAVFKLSAHDQMFLSRYSPPHTLRYRDGAIVDEMPEGGVFRLDKYKAQVGLDYNRITLFVTSQKHEGMIVTCIVFFMLCMSRYALSSI